MGKRATPAKAMFAMPGPARAPPAPQEGVDKGYGSMESCILFTSLKKFYCCLSLATMRVNINRTGRIFQDYFIDHQAHLYRNKDLILNLSKESGVSLLLLK